MYTDHDPAGVDVIDDAPAMCSHHRAGVDRSGALDAGADEGLFRAQTRHRLTLHVGTHQRAVGVVVFEEGNQRGGNRHDLRRRHVHVFDAVGR